MGLTSSQRVGGGFEGEGGGGWGRLPPLPTCQPFLNSYSCILYLKKLNIVNLFVSNNCYKKLKKILIALTALYTVLYIHAVTFIFSPNLLN